MGKQFVIRKLPESYEIQKSYDKGNYLEAVVKCRVYLEGWLIEYIYALLYPTESNDTRENRELVRSRFRTMFMQISWLQEKGHITKADYDNINKIRIFCDKAFRYNDFFKIATLETLGKYIEASVHYCYKFKMAIRDILQKATGQEIQL